MLFFILDDLTDLKGRATIISYHHRHSYGTCSFCARWSLRTHVASLSRPSASATSTFVVFTHLPMGDAFSAQPFHAMLLGATWTELCLLQGLDRAVHTILSISSRLSGYTNVLGWSCYNALQCSISISKSCNSVVTPIAKMFWIEGCSRT